jgi:hypothetical protein
MARGGSQRSSHVHDGRSGCLHGGGAVPGDGGSNECKRGAERSEVEVLGHMARREKAESSRNAVATSLADGHGKCARAGRGRAPLWARGSWASTTEGWGALSGFIDRERGSRGSSVEVGALCMMDTSRTYVSL